MFIETITGGAALGSTLDEAIASVTHTSANISIAVGTLVGAAAGLAVAMVAAPSVATAKTATTLAKAITGLARVA